MDEKTVEQSMQLILHSGTGRSMVIEAVRDMLKTGDVAAAKQKIEEGGKEIGEAHDIQTAMMSAECDGQPVEKSILLIHAQDSQVSVPGRFLVGRCDVRPAVGRALPQGTSQRLRLLV